MTSWYMLTLVGKDQAGIVSQITAALFNGGCNLGEASMNRLGVNFTMMLMVEFDGSVDALTSMVTPVTQGLGLQHHIDGIDGKLHQHDSRDVCLSVYGADRAGIVANVTDALAAAGLNILELESSVGGTDEKPIYIMQIDGHAANGLKSIEVAVEQIRKSGIEITLNTTDTMIG